MKGDFSKLAYRPEENFTGVLHQQGRVLLDQDWNAATAIGGHLRGLLARDAIGDGMVAVPAAAGESLRVTAATSDGSRVDVSLEPGRGWVDGLHFYLPGPAPVVRRADYLAPPIQDPQASPATIAAGVRDAVILEIWEEALSAFQDPEALLEPALGGPDTTERVQLAYALRLLRLGPGDDCGNLAGILADDFDAKGHLTVSPVPAAVVVGDCPVQLGGGYTGFEHYLYRIEVAAPDGGNARFKWSRFNGGLVGRGTWDNVASEVSIVANDQMINHCGLTDFYFEALAPDPESGHWRVVFTANASLVADGLLSLTNVAGTWPGTPGEPSAFFRLWDGIDLISSFPTGPGDPDELENGIRLAFDAPVPGNGNYTPGDYWTFPVRAAGVDFDPSVWPDDASPAGVHYHRAPLAILNWDAAPNVTLTGPPEIHDCRIVFPPLTRRMGCCSYRVGDGLTSHGDFDTIQEAVDHLPAAGGEICVLPGVYEENVVVVRDGVHIHGCGPRTRIVAPAAAPAVRVTGASNFRLASLAVTAHENGAGVLVETDANGREPVRIRLEGLAIQAARDSAIKILGARDVIVRECSIAMDDVPSPWPGLFTVADDVLIEHNSIVVAAPGAAGPAGDVVAAAAGRGGVQIGGTSERVSLIDNRIQGGIGNGITLGTVEEVDANGEQVFGYNGWVVNAFDPCDPCAPGDTYQPPGGGDDGDGSTFRSAGALYDLRIERNRILDMGLNGIGVVAFFSLEEQDEMISVDGLDVLGNTIRRCLRRDIELAPPEVQGFIGYGGVALADVENLVLHDNVIEDNGPDHLQPVCGVFVLHGEGVDISRNRILNNGAKTAQPVSDAKSGRRGGIYLAFVVPPTVPVEISNEVFPRQNGVPAAKIHGNVVSQPLGQALAILALGPVSVVGNQLTSRGMVPGFASPGFLASTVMILNMGLSNEIYLQNVLFQGTSSDPAGFQDTMTFGNDFVTTSRPGIDDAQIGQVLANGNVLFTDNQCVADLVETGQTFSVSSILILTLDDVAFLDNQCDCNFFDDFSLSNAIVIGVSARIANNRFKEGIGNALFSSVGLGLLFNTTTDNQSTHCLLSLNSPLSALPFLHPAMIVQNNASFLFGVLSLGDLSCGSLTESFANILVPKVESTNLDGNQDGPF